MFPEGDDIRVIDSLKRLHAEGLIGRAVLLGDRKKILDSISKAGAESVPVSIPDMNALSSEPRYRDEYRRARNLSELESEILEEAMKSTVVLGALMLRTGDVDGFIGGLRTASAEILSTGISIIKADRRIGVVTSLCLVLTGNESSGENGLYIITDPVVNPDPTVGVLCKIAEAASRFSRRYLGISPRIAFLSYSTKGSGGGKSVDKMRIAAERAREKMPEVIVDGELQLDAAISPEVARMKTPGSDIKGRANILVFPNLDSANIGSKILQFFGNAVLVGPIIYGLSKPYNDISRAATADDVYNLAIITQLQA